MPVTVAMALSGIDRDQWGDFQELYDHGAKVMNQEIPRRSRSRATNSTTSSRSSSPSSSSKESGIGSLSPEPISQRIPLTLRDYCLFKLEAMQCGDKKAMEIIEIFDAAGKEPEKVEEKEVEKPPRPVYTSELIWTGRNLLHLGDNLKGNAVMYQPAELPRGVQSYFENRSQISRVKGALTPPHKVHNCKIFTCKFEEPLFY